MSPRGCCSEGRAVPGDVEASSSRSFALIAYGVVEPCVPRHSPFVLGDHRVRRMARWTGETVGQRDGPVEPLARFVKPPERGLVARDPGPVAHRLRNSALVLARRREGAKWLEPTVIVADLEDQVWVWPRQELVPRGEVAHAELRQDDAALHREDPGDLASLGEISRKARCRSVLRLATHEIERLERGPCLVSPLPCESEPSTCDLDHPIIRAGFVERASSLGNELGRLVVSLRRRDGTCRLGDHPLGSVEVECPHESKSDTTEEFSASRVVGWEEVEGETKQARR